MIDKEKLKYYREMNHYTARKLSKVIHVPKKVIDSWEMGMTVPREADIDKLIKLYNISREDLVKEKKHISFKYIALIFYVLGGLFLGYIINKSLSLVILPIVLLLIGLIINKIITRKSNNNSPIKSLLGLSLNDNKKERLLIYFLESSLISLLYLVVVYIVKIFNMELFIIDISIIKNDLLNEIIVLLISIVVLNCLIYLIDLLFSESMMKYNKKEEEK